MLVVPKGHGAGGPFRLAKFQREMLEIILESLATFISIPAANGKTTFKAAMALERMCRGDDYVEIDVLATKEDQAQRLVEAAYRMIECSPPLHDLFEFWARSSTLEYRPTGSTMRAHPAKLSAVQGLDFKLALIDEIGFVPAELVESLLARLAKEPDARVIGFGTPGFEPDNMLERMRELYHAGELPAGVRFIEYAAEPGCDIYDREQWRRANPALDAGFLREEALTVQAATLEEPNFRAYHLGQPIATGGTWLPLGTWDACFDALPPSDGQKVVLSLWGTYRQRVSIVGCALDGSIFFGWAADRARDEEVEEALRRACEQWDVLEITHKPHIRIGLMSRLEDLPVEQWSSKYEVDKDSTAAFYQAIVNGELSHDHHPMLSESVARLQARIDNQGNPRLVDSSEFDVSAILAARAAWWRAKELAEDVQGEPVIY